MINANIIDGKGDDYKVKVTSRGQLITAPLDFSDAYSVSATVINTAYNFVTPKIGFRFVITDILLNADNSVGTTPGATVVLYEAASLTSTTATKTILSIELVKQTNRDITGLNLIVSEGVWLNIKTDDNNINATVLGYFVEA